MAEREHITALITDEEITQAISGGSQTSTEIAETLGVHRVTIRRKLFKMYQDGLIIRRKIGQTFIYAVKEE
jgi:transcription initiation factor IIE alpha subunit